MTTMKNSFKTGAIALAFLILGFELALFVHRAAVARIVAHRDKPDTVYVFDGVAERSISQKNSYPGDSRDQRSGIALATGSIGQGFPAAEGGKAGEHDTAFAKDLRRGSHSPKARAIYEKASQRKKESFRFNPNTVSLEELCRLGFTEKQAQSILNYREKGGRFRRKSDFAKSFVVEDSVFRRLEPFIDIPKIDINRADSAAFDTLPGIGGWFAHRMVEYREQLHGYSCPEQLMEIWHFDEEKYYSLRDLITCSAADPYPFWTGSVEDIRNHPHIRNWQTARDIAFYRDHNPPDAHTVGGLLAAGIISEEQAVRLARCRLK